MEIWIRNQDKKRLLKVSYLLLNGNRIEAIHDEFNFTILGTYSTKEKALKVLDGIQKYICQKDHLQQEYGVIQMPQDEEVI